MPDRIFLINVGANASHSVRSPLLPDGAFELLPIPEERRWWSPPLPTYAKLECFNDPGESLARYTGERYRGVQVHHDPEFESFTYGDNCGRSPRAAGLGSVGPGDYLLFLARLVRYEGGRFTGPAGFYLIGYLRVQEVLRDVRAFPSGRALTVFGANAHIRRAIYHRQALDGFCVFKGSPLSQRLRHAVPLTRSLAEEMLRDAHGNPWRWGEGRSELQTIGSYTRSVRCVLDPSRPEEARRAAALWRVIDEANPPGGWAGIDPQGRPVDPLGAPPV